MEGFLPQRGNVNLWNNQEINEQKHKCSVCMERGFKSGGLFYRLGVVKGGSIPPVVGAFLLERGSINFFNRSRLVGAVLITGSNAV